MFPNVSKKLFSVSSLIFSRLNIQRHINKKQNVEVVEMLEQILDSKFRNETQPRI